MFFTTRAFWSDFAERVVSTGAAGALTVVILASFNVFDLSSWRAVAQAAGVSALISALKAFSLQRTGTTTTTSSSTATTPDPVPVTPAAATSIALPAVVLPTIAPLGATATATPTADAAGGVTYTAAGE